MELNLHPSYDNDTIIAAACHPEIRLFAVPSLFATAPQAQLPAGPHADDRRAVLRPLLPHGAQGGARAHRRRHLPPRAAVAVAAAAL